MKITNSITNSPSRTKRIGTLLSSLNMYSSVTLPLSSLIGPTLVRTYSYELTSVFRPFPLDVSEPVLGRTVACIHDTIQYNAIHYNAMQCNAVRCGAVRCGAVRCGTTQRNATQRNTIQYNLFQHSGMSIISIR